MRDEVGQQMALGVGIGFEREYENINASMQSDFKASVREMSSNAEVKTQVDKKGYNKSTETTINIVNPKSTGIEIMQEARRIERRLVLGYN